MGRWDDVIEEAAGELEGVEGQLHTASRQLLDLRSATAQLSADAQKASDAKKQACTPCLHCILVRTKSLAAGQRSCLNNRRRPVLLGIPAKCNATTCSIQCPTEWVLLHSKGPPVVSSKFTA